MHSYNYTLVDTLLIFMFHWKMLAIKMIQSKYHIQFLRYLKMETATKPLMMIKLILFRIINPANIYYNRTLT